MSSDNNDGFLPLPCVLTWTLGMNGSFSTPFKSKGATMTWTDGVVNIAAGTEVDSAALFESNMLIHLNHREHNTIAYSIKFDEPAVGRDTMVGMGNTERGTFFGYKGLEFGHKVVIGGCREYAKITITGAPTANGLISVTLGGRTAQVGVGLGMTIGQVMASIAYSSALSAQNMRANSMCDRVSVHTLEAASYPEDPPSIDFGTTGVTGSIVLSKAGQAPQEEWIPSTAFTGAGSKSIFQNLNLMGWNIFRLKFNMWSAGGIELAVLNPHSNEYIDINEWRPTLFEQVFDTTVPYCTALNVMNTDSVASAGGVKVIGGAVLNGIPATAGLRGRFSKTFIKKAVATSAAGDSAVGVLCSPVIQDGPVRNTVIGTLYRLSVSIQSTVDVVCNAIISGISTAPFPCSRVLPWTALNYADVAGTNTVYGGMNYVAAFVPAGDRTTFELECDQCWICPGTYVAFCVKCAHPEDVGTTIDCVAYNVSWYET